MSTSNIANLDRAEALFLKVWQVNPGDIREALEAVLLNEQQAKATAYAPPLAADSESMRDLCVALNVVCAAYGVRREQVLSRRRTPVIARARQVAMWIAHRIGYSTTEIGWYLHRDHSTVLHGEAVIEASLERGEKDGLRARCLLDMIRRKET